MLHTTTLEREDFAPFIELARHMQEECEPEIDFDVETLLVNMFRCIGDPARQEFNIWLSMRNKKMIGMAVASTSEFYFSKVKTALLSYWYVLPEYRGTRAAAELLRTFERWARDVGAKRIYVGAERINDVDLADRINAMIEKRGYTRFGHQYYKRIN